MDPDVTPIARDTKHLHLRLEKLQGDIEAFVKKSSEEGDWSKNGKIITESWLKIGLRDRGITRDLRWGVPVPLDVFDKEEDRQVYKDKVFYVWCKLFVQEPEIHNTNINSRCLHWGE